MSCDIKYSPESDFFRDSNHSDYSRCCAVVWTSQADPRDASSYRRCCAIVDIDHRLSPAAIVRVSNQRIIGGDIIYEKNIIRLSFDQKTREMNAVYIHHNFKERQALLYARRTFSKHRQIHKQSPSILGLIA